MTALLSPSYEHQSLFTLRLLLPSLCRGCNKTSEIFTSQTSLHKKILKFDNKVTICLTYIIHGDYFSHEYP